MGNDALFDLKDVDEVLPRFEVEVEDRLMFLHAQLLLFFGRAGRLWACEGGNESKTVHGFGESPWRRLTKCGHPILILRYLHVPVSDEEAHVEEIFHRLPE